MSQDAISPLPLGTTPAPAPADVAAPDDTDSSFTANAPASAPRAFREKRRSNAPLWVALIVLAFLGGIAAAALAFPRLSGWWNGTAQPVMVATGVKASSPNAPVSLPADAARQDLLALRMSELEDRLARVSVAAQAASGNATRSEGMLVAFAARRALDSGSPLGYLEGQLRLRFGQAQPRAVATIINAAREPVTLIDLQAGFDDIAPSLRTVPPGTDWWTAFQREAHDLVIIRKASTPSPLPERAIPRIARLLASGRVAPAMEEIARLPGKATAERWLEMARRYREARRALDLIETAAILESPPVRVVPADLNAARVAQ
ncbi:hypothetical protein C1T17_03135 [Sphingobium sp. SCG-1]|uniref:hypothetical protein n=1 Tax=Sphingobium sp. SCG-1 TaxID=2072936 RepID=UPI000CD6A74E|nr:hypothetical protein [Sphingobium sp. SCG-1]AUW57231.1 hypothetical protein C1T17_03135 [Sphingobium sp. SCG-1]